MYTQYHFGEYVDGKSVGPYTVQIASTTPDWGTADAEFVAVRGPSTLATHRNSLADSSNTASDSASNLLGGQFDPATLQKVMVAAAILLGVQSLILIVVLISMAVGRSKGTIYQPVQR